MSPSPPSVSSEYLTSFEVTGSPSDQTLSGSSLKVTVLRSSETSQLSAMPGDGERSSALKLTSRSQFIDQTLKSSSSSATNGFRVCGSWAQPIRSTEVPSSAVVESAVVES